MCRLYSYFETHKPNASNFTNMPCSNTAGYQRLAHAVMFLLSCFVQTEKNFCTLGLPACQHAIVLFGWNEKARWMTQCAMVLLFAITWRTLLQSNGNMNGKDLLGCYIILNMVAGVKNWRLWHHAKPLYRIKITRSAARTHTRHCLCVEKVFVRHGRG